jgi:hypothetical protein
MAEQTPELRYKDEAKTIHTNALAATGASRRRTDGMLADDQKRSIR